MCGGGCVFWCLFLLLLVLVLFGLFLTGVRRRRAFVESADAKCSNAGVLFQNEERIVQRRLKVHRISQNKYSQVPGAWANWTIFLYRCQLQYVARKTPNTLRTAQISFSSPSPNPPPKGTTHHSLHPQCFPGPSHHSESHSPALNTKNPDDHCAA